MPRHCYVLRVFTRGDEGGNHLGVVTDCSGLPPVKMQEIAAELGFSETIFLDWRERDVPKVRIFTPSAELPFAGHPLVGMAWLLHALGPGGASSIECGIGLVNIGMDGDTAWVDAPLNQRVHTDADLEGYDPGATPLSITRIEMPVPYYVVELAEWRLRPGGHASVDHPDRDAGAVLRGRTGRRCGRAGCATGGHRNDLRVHSHR